MFFLHLLQKCSNYILSVLQPLFKLTIVAALFMFRSYRDGTGKNRSLYAALEPAISPTILLGTLTLWAALSPIAILQREPRLFCLTVGITMSNICVSNTLFVGQRLQDTLLVTQPPRRIHIALVLNALHCLHVQYHIQYKLLLLVFHSLQGSAPQYNCQLITRYNPSRCLGSSTSSLMVVPQFHNNWGDRAFPMLVRYFETICPLTSVTCQLFISSKRLSKPTFSLLLFTRYTCFLPCAMSITCDGYRILVL